MNAEQMRELSPFSVQHSEYSVSSVPPLTLSLSPEYEGEGTGAGLAPDRGGTPRL
ncbi:MAG: hypothetical protein JWP03_940 [Phycisphaerales bacterium]|nr:hypothetical protein [Phycisphaerales bacterium]